jgi:DNA-binding PadR family transcriptional regulator
MLTRLVVLGLLLQRPMSGYTIQLTLQMNKTEQWAGILPGSIYHAIKKLASEELIVLQTTEQSGNRTKAIYALTEAGREEFQRLLREAWRTPVLHFPSGLYTALGFLEDLHNEEIMHALDEQIAHLEKELALWNAGEDLKAQYLPVPMPDYQRALFANGREHMEIDLRLLRYLRETLPSAPRLSLTPLPIEEETDE